MMQCKQIQNRVFTVFFNNKNFFVLKKPKKRIKKQKTQAGCYFVKVSFSTLIIFQSCCDFPLIA